MEKCGFPHACEGRAPRVGLKAACKSRGSSARCSTSAARCGHLRAGLGVIVDGSGTARVPRASRNPGTLRPSAREEVPAACRNPSAAARLVLDAVVATGPGDRFQFGEPYFSHLRRPMRSLMRQATLHSPAPSRRGGRACTCRPSPTACAARRTRRSAPRARRADAAARCAGGAGRAATRAPSALQAFAIAVRSASAPEDAKRRASGSRKRRPDRLGEHRVQVDPERRRVFVVAARSRTRLRGSS
jgi:hypothetical protein